MSDDPSLEEVSDNQEELKGKGKSRRTQRAPKPKSEGGNPKAHRKDTEHSEEEEEEDSEEEFDKGVDQYVEDDFVVGDDAEEEEGGEAPKKRKKRRMHREKPLEEEDLDLIMDNYQRMGASVPSHIKQKVQVAAESKGKLKRLKKATDTARNEAPKVQSVDTLGRELFGEEEEEEMEQRPPEGKEEKCEEEYREEDEELGSEEEDMKDFIVEGEEVAGEVMKPRVRGRRHGGAAVSVQQLRIAEEIFGDPSMMDEGVSKVEMVREKDLERQAAKLKEPRLEEIYEPKEIEELFVTEKDRVIKQTDLPERMQAALEGRLKPTAEELQAEATWIWKQRKERDPKELIFKVLEAYRVEYFEPPFIYTYRRHIYKQQFEKKDIWNICKLDQEWGYLMKLKGEIAGKLGQVVANFKQFAFVSDELQKAQSLGELEDIEAFANFYGSLISIGKGQGVVASSKLTRKQQQLAKWVKGRIHEFAERLLLKPWEFDENLRNMRAVKTPPDVKMPVPLIAKEYISEQGKELIDEKSVLQALTAYAASEIAVLPYLRKMVREYYFANAVVSTVPTPKGESELDIFHPSYRVKYIVARPLSSFSNDLWLDIKAHEAKGFVKLTIGLDKTKTEELMAQLVQYYIQDDESKDEIVTECNTLRSEILQKAFNGHLIPATEHRARKQLEDAAEEFVIHKCSEQFRRQIMAGPYRSNEEGKTEEQAATESGIKVLSFVVDVEMERRPVVQMTIVNENGELLEHKQLRTIIMRNPDNLNPTDRTAFDQDKGECLRVIRDHDPNLIVVGSNRLEAQMLKKALREWVEENKMEVEKLDREIGKRNDCWVAWGDTTVPKIFSISEAAKKQLPSVSPLVRAAVSLARLKQDALSEILNLWNQDENVNGVFSMNLHPLQRLVTLKKLEEALEQVSVESVNDVGVDLNKIVDYPHKLQTLQFICGLGPRKAQDIILGIQKKGKICMRMHLLAKYVGSTVYKNCVGFLKIASISIDEDEPQDLLDQTRIHPESYFLAKKIATEAIADDMDGIDFNDETAVLSRIMRNPKKLNKLDLKRYAEQLERANQANSKLQVEFVVQELISPFSDPRPRHEDLGDKELFYLLLGESEQTFKKGMIMSATVIHIHDKNIRCKLENGMDAFIKKDSLREGYEDQDVFSESLTENTVIPARITDIITDDGKYMVNLSARKQDLRMHTREMISLSIDDSKWFYINGKDLENRKMIEEERKRHAKYIPRRIPHKKFKNVSLVKANEFLANKDVGEFIFRPSSKGEDNLTLTLKCYKNINVHVDIREDDKPLGSSLGHKLLIGNEYYESLDEIIARFVTPVLDYAKETAGSRKFIDSVNIKMVEDYLLGEQEKNPNMIAYCVTMLPDFPQYIILAYCPKKDKIISEYVKIKPQGYFFHDAYHKNIASLIAWFKSHFTDTDYQRYLKKFNRPPTLATAKKEVTEIRDRPMQQDEWGGLPDDWRGPSASMELGAVTEEAKTSYLPNTDYNREPMDSSGWGEGEKPFSSYAPNPTQTGMPRRGMVTCFNCNQEGHMSRECPNWDARGGGRGMRDRGARGRGGMESEGDAWGWGEQPSADDKPWGDASALAASNAEEKPTDAWGGIAAAGNEWGGPAPTTDAWGPGPIEPNVAPYSGFNTMDRPADSWGGGRGGRGDRGDRGRGDRGRGYRGSGDRGDRGRGDRFRGDRGDRGRSRGGGRACFNCGEEGHMSKECPNRERGGGGGGRGARTCFKCGQPGHLSRDCPEGGAPRGGGGDRRPRGRGGDWGGGENRSRSRDHDAAPAWGSGSNAGWGDQPAATLPSEGIGGWSGQSAPAAQPTEVAGTWGGPPNDSAPLAGRGESSTCNKAPYQSLH